LRYYLSVRSLHRLRSTWTTESKPDAALFPDPRSPAGPRRSPPRFRAPEGRYGSGYRGLLLRTQPRDPRDGGALGRTARPDRSQRLGIHRPTDNGARATLHPTPPGAQRGHGAISAKVFVRACPSSTPAPWMLSSRSTSANATNARKGNTATKPTPSREITTEQEGETETNGGFQPLLPNTMTRPRGRGRGGEDAAATAVAAWASSALRLSPKLVPRGSIQAIGYPQLIHPHPHLPQNPQPQGLVLGMTRAHTQKRSVRFAQSGSCPCILPELLPALPLPGIYLYL
jgi:hypothetical protein